MADKDVKERLATLQRAFRTTSEQKVSTIHLFTIQLVRRLCTMQLACRLLWPEALKSNSPVQTWSVRGLLAFIEKLRTMIDYNPQCSLLSLKRDTSPYS